MTMGPICSRYKYLALRTISLNGNVHVARAAFDAAVIFPRGGARPASRFASLS
jgi:hypothetical protein